MNEQKNSEELIDKKWKVWVITGCLIPMGLLILVCLLLMLWFSRAEMGSGKQKPDYIKNAEAKVQVKTQELTERQKKLLLENDKKGYDIDETIKALFSIEKGMKDAKNFEELTEFIMQKDSDQVAPEVMKLKYRFFNIYKNMIDAQDGLEEINSLYNVSTGALLDILSSFDYTILTVNREQAERVWGKRMQDAKTRENIKNRLMKYQNELLDFYFDYLKLNAKYMKEWNQLCAVRDRAYLAVYEKDWGEAKRCAQQAVKLSPTEKEAHILLAMALLESGGETETTMAKGIVKDFLERSQGQDAPGHLLSGVINLKEKKYDKAILDFDQSATYFPKQQEVLLEKLNLYKKRQFLNKSKEGRMIINIYRGIMTGSGYFSPDFQKARIYLAKGQKEKAKRKIFDHFFRRRLQGQWDRVLTDFHYCYSFLKTDLYDVFEVDEINLEIDSAMFTNSVIVTVKNNSNIDIHNMTILLCVRFTDMFKGDYISFPVGETVALLKAGESVNVGRKNISDITEEKLGTEKSFKDIIEYAAVLISDEVITWVEPVRVEEIKDREDYPEINKNNKKYDSSTDVIKDNIKTVVNKVIDKAVDAVAEEKKPVEKKEEETKKEKPQKK